VDNLMSYLWVKSKTESVTMDTAFALIVKNISSQYSLIKSTIFTTSIVP
jgi:hypothetical protein